MKKVINIMLLSLLCFGCTRLSTERSSVIAYVEDRENGLRKTVTAGDYVYVIQYKPADYILKLEHRSGDTTRAKQLRGMAWFNISFHVQHFDQSPLRYKVSGIEEYAARQDYFLNGAAKDIHLVYDGQILPVTAYWFENNQNLTPYETMIAGFRLPEGATAPMKDMQIVFQNKLFGNGIIKAVITQKALKEIPVFKN